VARSKKNLRKPCVTRLTPPSSTAIVGETPDTGHSLLSATIMPNPKGHEDSIKDSRFKPAWSGPTRTIRVPIALAEVTLEYARQLDQGVEPRDTVQSSDNETSSDNFEPRDTQKEASNQADNSIDTLSAEARDTGKTQAELEDARADYAKLLESSTHITNKLKEEVQKLRSQLEQERADRSEIEEELAELAQLKKEAKEAAAEVHREENSMKLEKVRWQRELGDARAQLADARATILNQGNKIRELERGYSLKPNPAERRLRLEIGELHEQLSELKQKSATAGKDLPEAANLYNQLKAKRKKSSASLADVELILEMIEEF